MFEQQYVEENDDCPCGSGKMEIFHLRDGGCYCFRCAPCSYCTDITYACSYCGADCEELDVIYAQYKLDKNPSKWNKIEHIIFNTEFEHYLEICQKHELPINHHEWSDADQVMFRLAV